MNRMQQSGGVTLRWRRWQLWVLLGVLIASTLTVTGVAFAQQSNSFDFACWSVATGGGGKHTTSSLNFMLQDAVVGGAAGISSSSNFRVRAGYAQNMTFLKPGTGAEAAAALTTAGSESDNVLHLPIISSYVRITRTCPG